LKLQEIEKAKIILQKEALQK